MLHRAEALWIRPILKARLTGEHTGRQRDLRLHWGRLSTDNVSMTLKFAEQGYGIAALSPTLAAQACEAGSIRRVLDQWSFPPMPVHAVMTSRLLPAPVRLFVDFLANRLTTRMQS
jgi:DNA-binding transcriptional LysR family regulator